MARQGNIGRPVEVLIYDIAVEDESLCPGEIRAVFRKKYVIRPGIDINDGVTPIGSRRSVPGLPSWFRKCNDRILYAVSALIQDPTGGIVNLRQIEIFDRIARYRQSNRIRRI